MPSKIRTNPPAEPDSAASEGWLLGWARHPEGWALFIFVFASMFLNGSNQQRLLGILLCGLAVVAVAREPRRAARLLRPVPLEMRCYAGWVLWAGLTGPFVVLDPERFWTDYRVVVQMLAMVAAVYAVLRLRPQALGGVLLGVVAGGLVQVGAVLSGAASIAESIEGKQALGATANPNGLGFFMVWSSLCLLLLWGFAGRYRRWIAAAALLIAPTYAYVLLASGSRKSFIAFIFLVSAWTLSASSLRRGMAGKAWRMAAFILVLTLLHLALPIIVEHTTLGARFEQFLVKGGADVVEGTDDRYWMYVEGLKMFFNSPVCGVGLNNFGQHFWYQTYSHSDYIEPLATTGLVGFLLYHAFYVVILARTFRLLTRVNNPSVRYRLKVIAIAVFTIMLIGIGAPHYETMTVFVLLPTFGVYSAAVERDLNHRRTTVPVAARVGWGAPAGAPASPAVPLTMLAGEDAER